MLLKYYGLDNKFEIIGIDYLPTKVGYAAIITYKTSNNRIGSYGEIYETPYSIDSKNIKELSTN